MIRISDIGEKQLISGFLRPLFNPTNEVGGVGDDCAMIEGLGGQVWLFSTDRVPSDLTAFRLGILDHAGLGAYLARLNISDIAACGGRPLAVLLNLGLPEDLPYEVFTSLCSAFGQVATACGCKVLGGDITSSRDISVSATAIGMAEAGRVLTRRGALPGDAIFISRPIGLTPAAFAFLLQGPDRPIALEPAEVEVLKAQFTLDPMLAFGRRLTESGQCTSCMDNTDGLGQSLLELSTASGCAFVINSSDATIPPLVQKIASQAGEPQLRLAMSAGADFSLVGTLRGNVTPEQAAAQFGDAIQLIGHTEAGTGVLIETASGRQPLDFVGWNYFRSRR